MPITDIAKSLAKRQPIVLIDQATGRRQLIWAELDANAKGAANTDLLIHPAKLLAEGHTFIVALRDLRTKAGKLIAAPRWFARLRDGGKLPAAERSQKTRYAPIFKALRRAGIAADRSLYEAWNFTVESRAEPDRPDAGDPQRRLRPARRHATSPTRSTPATRRRSP